MHHNIQAKIEHFTPFDVDQRRALYELGFPEMWFIYMQCIDSHATLNLVQLLLNLHTESCPHMNAGGVGPTIMETSYLLAGTPVIAYADGQQVQAKPISQPLTIDFGKGLGRKTVWLYNLPEVESAFKYMKVPNVSARFGTDPGKLILCAVTCALQDLVASDAQPSMVCSRYHAPVGAFATAYMCIQKSSVEARRGPFTFCCLVDILS